MMMDSHSYSRPVTAIVPTGSGAIGFHRQLANLLTGYEVLSYSPSLELTPWRLRRFRPKNLDLIHAAPDHAIWVTPPGNPLVATFLNYVLDPEMRAHSTLAQRLHYMTDLRLFTRRAMRRAAAVTAVSHATAQLVRDDLGYNGVIHVIPNSVDSTRFCPVDAATNPNPRRVLFCATPSRRKGFHWLDAIAKGIGDIAELACATGGRAAPAGDHSHLKQLGAIRPDALPELYRSASVFVLPSVREGMSLAQLEAMATGLPVVAWRVPSSMELLGDVQSDLLAELGDVDGFIERVRWLLCNPDRASEVGARNRRMVISSHQPSAMAGTYSSLFTKVSNAAELDD
jgi:glycosyltransferase involved in cell wall biosynthesis